MSRYESSRFVKDPKIMNKEVLRQACDKLGWKYVEQGNDFLVTNLNRGEQLYGEYALKLHDGQVTYNSYYLSNGGQLVAELQSVFFPLNVEYAKNSVISSFSANGFTYKPDYHFKPDGEVAEQFFMVGFTKLPGEKEKRFEIGFKILKDGTVVTDSNYLPDDVNDLAHKSMDNLQTLFGRERVMTKKPEYDEFIRRHGLVSSVTGKKIEK
jgi:hypothetical protein